MVEITRIRYTAPVSVPAGIVEAMVPELAVEVNVPMVTGAVKLPAASDN